MNNKINTILIFGPPGVGKSTQAKLLDKDKFFYISTGELLRRFEERTEFKQSILGKKVSKIMNSGFLVPDHMIYELLVQIIKEDINDGVYNSSMQTLILDGFPRDISQVKMIDEHFKVIKIIDIYSSDDSELADRILKRAENEKRAEDQNIETIKKRFSIYKEETSMVLECYPREIIVKINGINTVENIHLQIENNLSTLK